MTTRTIREWFDSVNHTVPQLDVEILIGYANFYILQDALLLLTTPAQSQNPNRYNLLETFANICIITDKENPGRFLDTVNSITMDLMGDIKEQENPANSLARVLLTSTETPKNYTLLERMGIWCAMMQLAYPGFDF